MLYPNIDYRNLSNAYISVNYCKQARVVLHIHVWLLQSLNSICLTSLCPSSDANTCLDGRIYVHFNYGFTPFCLMVITWFMITANQFFDRVREVFARFAWASSSGIVISANMFLYISGILVSKLYTSLDREN